MRAIVAIDSAHRAVHAPLGFMKPLEPKTLFASRYEIVRCISTGGMGAVYEVLHRETKRRRALKLMLPGLLVDDEMRRRFALEAVITADVASEHLVEVFDAGIEPGSEAPFIVMELLDGEDLGKHIAKRGPLPPDEVAEILRQTARALDKTHAAGIIHRDLKPDNLFLTQRDDGSPKVKILDFGIAKLLATQGGPSTRAMGTPLFMAPEQVDDELAKPGPAVDLFALGQIAYVLLTGTPYYADDAKRSDNLLAMLLVVSRGPQEIASVRALRIGRTLFAGFDAWFAKATAKDPKARFASAKALSEAFDRALDAPPSLTVAAQTNAASDATPRGAFSGTLPMVVESAQPSPAAAVASSASAAHDPTPSNVAQSNTASIDPTVSNAIAASRQSRRLWGALAALAVSGAVVALLAFDPFRTDAPSGELGSGAQASAPPGRVSAEPTVEQAPLVSPSLAASAVAPQPLVADTPATAVSSSAPGPRSSAPAAQRTAAARVSSAPSSKPSAVTLPWEERTPIKP